MIGRGWVIASFALASWGIVIVLAQANIELVRVLS